MNLKKYSSIFNFKVSISKEIENPTRLQVEDGITRHNYFSGKYSIYADYLDEALERLTEEIEQDIGVLSSKVTISTSLVGVDLIRKGE